MVPIFQLLTGPPFSFPHQECPVVDEDTYTFKILRSDKGRLGEFFGVNEIAACGVDCTLWVGTNQTNCL